jgi:hypothetical protein
MCFIYIYFRVVPTYLKNTIISLTKRGDELHDERVAKQNLFGPDARPSPSPLLEPIPCVCDKARFIHWCVPLDINKSKFNHTSNIKSSSATSRTNSEFATSGVEPGRNLADTVTFFVAMAGGRKDAEVAGRLGRRDGVETVVIRGVEVMYPMPYGSYWPSGQPYRTTSSTDVMEGWDQSGSPARAQKGPDVPFTSKDVALVKL